MNTKFEVVFVIQAHFFHYISKLHIFRLFWNFDNSYYATKIRIFFLTGSEVLIGNHSGDFASCRLKKVNHLVLIAAGSGLKFFKYFQFLQILQTNINFSLNKGFTPMAKILQKFYQYHEQQGRTGKRKCSFLFFNKTEADIIWKNQMDQVEKETLTRYESWTTLQFKDPFCLTHYAQFSNIIFLEMTSKLKSTTSCRKIRVGQA